MAGKKFSLEAVLSLGDKFSAPFGKLNNKMDAFSKRMKVSFGQDFAPWINGMSKGIDKVAKSLGIAATASVAASVAIVQSTATSADAFIKQARIIGITTEELQALTYAADLQGVSSETLNKSLEKMMRSLGELQNGEGALGKYLATTDRGLLRQLQSASSTEEAFTLLMAKLGSMPDEFSRAQFAQLAFGKSGMDMIKMAEGGGEAISGLLAEAHKYGVISEDASLASEEYLDNLARLKAMFLGLKNQVFSALIPKLSAVVEAFVKLFDETNPGASIIDRLSDAIDKIDPAAVIQGLKDFWGWITETVKIIVDFIKFVAPLAPMLLTLVVAIKTIAAAMAIYNAVMAITNILSMPYAAIVIAITVAIAALVAVVVWMVKNWDKVLEVAGKVVSVVGGALTQAWQGFIEILGNVWSVIEQIGQAFVAFLLAPINLVIDAIEGLLTLISKIPGMGDKLAPALSAIKGFQGGMNEFLTGNAAPVYASPSTYGAEARSYSESRSVSEVFVRPERGAAVATTPGGPAQPSLSYGRLQ